MNSQDFQLTMQVDATPHEVFNAINSVEKWWSENMEGSAQKLNDEFTVRFFDDIHVSTQKVVEFIPDKKVEWLVTKSNLNFIEDKNEWDNTRIIFEISKAGDKTQINFTHIGLLPEVECYKDCSVAWPQYLRGSLGNLITTGIGNPTQKDAKLSVQ